MLRRSTWIILIVFLAILGGSLYFQKYQSEKNAQITPTVANDLLLVDLDQTQVAHLEIESSQGKKLSITKNEADSWVVEGFTAVDTNTYAVDDMFTKMKALTILSELSTAPALDVIGLSTPAYMIRITYKDGQQKTISIGKLTPTNSGYYAQLGQGKTVVVSKFTVENLLTFLDNPPVATPVPTVIPTTTGEMTPTPQP